MEVPIIKKRVISLSEIRSCLSAFLFGPSRKFTSSKMRTDLDRLSTDILNSCQTNYGIDNMKGQ